MLLEGFVPTEEAPAMEVALEKEGYYFQGVGYTGWGSCSDQAEK